MNRRELFEKKGKTIVAAAIATPTAENVEMGAADEKPADYFRPEDVSNWRPTITDYHPEYP